MEINMSVRRKFLCLKNIIIKSRPTKRGYALNDLNQATNGLFQMTNIMRNMSAKEINSCGKVENGIMTIDLNHLKRKTT